MCVSSMRVVIVLVFLVVVLSVVLSADVPVFSTVNEIRTSRLWGSRVRGLSSAGNIVGSYGYKANRMARMGRSMARVKNLKRLAMGTKTMAKVSAGLSVAAAPFEISNAVATFRDKNSSKYAKGRDATNAAVTTGAAAVCAGALKVGLGTTVATLGAGAGVSALSAGTACTGAGLVALGTSLGFMMKDRLSGRKFDFPTELCQGGGRMAHLKNVSTRCRNIRVEDKDGKVFAGQSPSSGCWNAEWKFCVPKGGRIKILDRVHCGGRKNRSSYIPWSLLDKIPTKRKIEVRRSCKDSYPRYTIEGNRFFGDATPNNDKARATMKQK